jgi:hypothetical protein
LSLLPDRLFRLRLPLLLRHLCLLGLRCHGVEDERCYANVSSRTDTLMASSTRSKATLGAIGASGIVETRSIRWRWTRRNMSPTLIRCERVAILRYASICNRGSSRKPVRCYGKCHSVVHVVNRERRGSWSLEENGSDLVAPSPKT